MARGLQRSPTAVQCERQELESYLEEVDVPPGLLPKALRGQAIVRGQLVHCAPVG